MDFLLKKIITLFVMPFPLGILLFILGLIYLYRNKFLKAKIILTLSMMWFFLISYSPLINRILYTYEASYPTLKMAPKNIQYIYILGGGHHSDLSLPITSQIAESSVIRLAEGIRLFKQLEEKPMLIVSGYSGLNDPNSSAVMQNKLMLALGIPSTKLHLEPLPRDTQEEAKAAKKYISNAPFILVTSASHMKRALKFFKHEGLHPVPAPTNHLAKIKHINYLTGIFSVTALRKANIVWHEMLGLIWQKIKGV